MDRTISVRSNWNIRDPPVVHFDRFVITVGRTCFFLFEKVVVPSKAPLYPAYKNNNQTHSGMDQVFATGMYSFIECHSVKISTQ